jgi:flagellar motor switch protein FliM
MLDPRLLGRPVHLLPRFAARLGEELAATMASPAWRRNWGAFRLDSIEFGRVPDAGPLRWLGVDSAQGAIAVAFERVLLLGLLDCRYGRRGAAPVARDPALERVTATEERLAVVLTQQVAEVLSARVVGALTAAGVGTVGAPLTPAAPSAAPARAGWTIRVVLREPQSGHTGQYWMACDHELMGHILQGLLTEKARPRVARAPAEPLAPVLQVKLEGRLVSKEITLAALFELQVGDVIPVSVGRAEVLLDESRLFTAAVAEHKGKLCLTSFEDAE